MDQVTPAKISDLTSARSKHQSATRDLVIIEGVEVSEATAMEWIEANIGPAKRAVPRITVPHSRGEKVVQQTGPVPDSWALVDFGRRA